jgi:HMG (high mobility group) box
MSFALHPNKVNLPPLYLMFVEDNFAPAPGARSHAKKKPADYIPRPKNAFIIFRTLYSKWNATLPRVADPNRPDQPVAISDHRSLSKHAGEAWRCMTEDEKAPYKDLADEDKAQHRIKHPDYKYSPGERAPSKKIKKGKTEKRSESPPSSVTSDNADQSIVDEIVTLYPAARKRSSSCPPTASQSWNVSHQQPVIFDSEQEGVAPVFTNPWSNSLCTPDDFVSQIPDVRRFDGPNSWSRRSKDDFSVSYGTLRSFSPNPGLCNSYGEFAKRLSRYDTSIPTYTSSTLSSALVPPTVHASSHMQLKDIPQEFSYGARWDRRKSRDDLDMHLSGPSASISRTRRGQDIRKASIDDIGINYGSSARVYEWDQVRNSFFGIITITQPPCRDSIPT